MKRLCLRACVSARARERESSKRKQKRKGAGDGKKRINQPPPISTLDQSLPQIAPLRRGEPPRLGHAPEAAEAMHCLRDREDRFELPHLSFLKKELGEKT